MELAREESTPLVSAGPGNTTIIATDPSPLPVPFLPSRLGDYLEGEGRSALRARGPLLIGFGAVSAQAVVYSLGLMTDIVGPTPVGLDDEVARLWIGRSPRSDILLGERTVSRRHAVIIRRRGGAWSIADLGSRNGTFVDGRRLRPGEPANLGISATLHLGPIEGFSFLCEPIFADYVDALRGCPFVSR